MSNKLVPVFHNSLVLVKILATYRHQYSSQYSHKYSHRDKDGATIYLTNKPMFKIHNKTPIFLRQTNKLKHIYNYNA